MLNKVSKYNYINDEFYNFTSKYKNAIIQNDNGLILYNDSEKSHINLADIFFVDSFTIDVNEHEKIRYKIEKTEDFKSYFINFSGKYPNIIESNIDNMTQQIRLIYEMINRYDRNKDHIYCEENQEGFVNLYINKQFIKIDLDHKPRILSINNNKLSLFSTSMLKATANIYLKEIFKILKIKA